MTTINSRYDNESCLAIIHTVTRRYIETVAPQTVNNARYVTVMAIIFNHGWVSEVGCTFSTPSEVDTLANDSVAQTEGLFGIVPELFLILCRDRVVVRLSCVMMG